MKYAIAYLYVLLIVLVLVLARVSDSYTASKLLPRERIHHLYFKHLRKFEKYLWH